MHTIKDILSKYRNVLQDIYDKHEIEAIFYRILAHYHLINRIDVSLNPELTIEPAQMLEALKELQQYKPWQYITGETAFYGLRFKVTPATLIPRHETEELVDWVIRDCHNLSGLNILDIGTGSGAIAVSLAVNLPQASVTAIDFSEAALKTAEKNARLNHVEITFKQINILKQMACQKHYDIIVSNPPYVREEEKKMMHNNVLQFEPATALFVPDDKPLIFYDKIIRLAQKNSSSYVYFEINEFLKTGLENLLKQTGITVYEFRKDLFGKWRFLKLQP